MSPESSTQSKDFNLKRVFFCHGDHGRIFQQNRPFSAVHRCNAYCSNPMPGNRKTRDGLDLRITASLVETALKGRITRSHLGIPRIGGVDAEQGDRFGSGLAEHSSLQEIRSSIAMSDVHALLHIPNPLRACLKEQALPTRP